MPIEHEKEPSKDSPIVKSDASESLNSKSLGQTVVDFAPWAAVTLAACTLAKLVWDVGSSMQEAYTSANIDYSEPVIRGAEYAKQETKSILNPDLQIAATDYSLLTTTHSGDNGELIAGPSEYKAQGEASHVRVSKCPNNDALEISTFCAEQWGGKELIFELKLSNLSTADSSPAPCLVTLRNISPAFCSKSFTVVDNFELDQTSVEFKRSEAGLSINFAVSGTSSEPIYDSTYVHTAKMHGQLLVSTEELRALGY